MTNVSSKLGQGPKNVQDKDVFSRLFPYTFEGKASTWYFYLRQGSIISGEDFESAFSNKFGDDKIPVVLVLDLSKIKMDPKEKCKYFYH
jgi:hypothetical protein